MFDGEIRLSGGLLKISINPAACGANPARFTRTRERGLPSRVSIRQRRSLSLLPREGGGAGGAFGMRGLLGVADAIYVPGYYPALSDENSLLLWMRIYGRAT